MPASEIPGHVAAASAVSVGHILPGSPFNLIDYSSIRANGMHHPPKSRPAENYDEVAYLAANADVVEAVPVPATFGQASIISRHTERTKRGCCYGSKGKTRESSRAAWTNDEHGA